MTRTEFIAAYCDHQKEQRATLQSREESEAHIKDRAAAASLWRKKKAWLGLHTVEEWRKLAAK